MKIIVDRDWIDKTAKAYGHKGANQHTNKSESFASGLTPQELAYLQSYEDEKKRDQEIAHS